MRAKIFLDRLIPAPRAPRSFAVTALAASIGLAGAVGSRAQSSVGFSAYSESPTVKRWQSSLDRAIKASEAYQTGKKGKDDPQLKTVFEGKKFEGQGKLSGDRTADGVGTFRLPRKDPGGKDFATRSFFGIKNPWFGRMVDPDQEMTFGTREQAEASQTFATDAAPTREFFQADKAAAARREPVPTRAATPDGGAQGALDVLSQTNQGMSIDQVRKLLNKR